MDEILNEVNGEYVRELANLSSEIEEKDLNPSRNPSLEIFSSTIKIIKGKIMDYLYDSGLKSTNDMNYIEEKLYDAEMQIKMNSVECRKDEFIEKFNHIENNIKTVMDTIYSQKEEVKEELKRTVKDGLSKIIEDSFDNSREIDDNMASKFEYLNSNTFEQLISSINNRFYNLDSDKTYEILNTIKKYLEDQNQSLKQDFDVVSKNNTEKFHSIYNRKVESLYEKVLDDLNLRTEEEKNQQKVYEDLESQFKQ